ncbi:MAG: LuxR C-terminal-related transcriptional regulator, partial [Chloroflexota bacterium]
TTLDQVTNESRDFGRNPLINLSAREREVLNYFVLGKSRSEIAELLFITPGTVSTYRKRIYQKLDITDHAGLMQLAIDNNLIG